MKTGTISIKEVIGRVKRHKLLQSLPDETISDWSVEFLRLMNLNETFEEKLVSLEVKNFRTVLPDDFYEVIQVRTYRGDNGVPMYFRAMTDKFYQSENKKNAVPFTYKLQGKIMYISPIPSCKVEITYKAIELDDCGLPCVPDDEKYLRALEAYIKMRRFTDLYDEGEIKRDVLDNAQTDYYFAAGACHTNMKMPTLDEMKGISNIVNSMLPRTRSHHRGYADAGTEEIYKIH